MASYSYRFWNPLDLRQAILDLEVGISAGTASVSYNAAGSVTWTTLENARTLIMEMNAAYDRLIGLTPSVETGITFHRPIMRSGY